MQVPLKNHRGDRGQTLLVTVAVAALIGLSLATFLSLTSSQNLLTTRSQVWNGAMPVVEAGIEEALGHCQENYKTNMISNGWGLYNGAYIKSNQVGEGYYLVAISETVPYEIVSRGFLPMPGSRTYISRTVKVTTEPQGILFGALVVKDSIKLNGNNIRTDSYDSTDPNKSTGGLYDPLKVGDDGDVGCASGLQNSLSVGNADIYGKILTSPTAEARIGPNGSVGSVDWHLSGNSGIEPGWWFDDLNMDFPDVEPPFVSAPPAGGGTVGGTNYAYVLGNGQFEANSLSGSVYVSGDATLLVRGDVKFQSTDQLIIAPGARLQLYVAGQSAKIGTLVNQTGSAHSFLYFGLPTNKELTILGTGKMAAGLYAPNAAITFDGAVDFYGSIIAREAALNGAGAFHYDESLAKVPPTRRVVVNSWTEI